MSPGIAWLASVALTTAVTAQDPLARGIELYWAGQYQETVRALTELRDGELRRDEKVECLKYLAFSHVAMANETEAQAVFAELLNADPNFELDTSQLSPKILKQFESSRTRLVRELFEEGKAFYAADKYDETYQIMTRILELDTAFELASEYRALAAEQIELIEKAAALEPPEETPPPAAPSPAPAPGDRVYHVTGDMSRPILISRVSPAYPVTARRARREGTVVITMVVGIDGSVRAAKIIRSVSSDIDRAALSAVRKWRYRPAVLNGQSVAVHLVAQVAFQLND